MGTPSSSGTLDATAVPPASVEVLALGFVWFLWSVPNDEVALTHEFLSIMLGVQRAGVTLAIQNLEGAGHIRAKRRRIEVRDRDKLLELTSGSYGTPETEYARLIEGT